MQINKKIIFFIVALLLCGILIYVLLPSAKYDASGDEPLQTPAVAVLPEESHQATVPQSEIARLNEPLPTSEPNLAGVYDELKRRADAGNAKAACRLGLELIKCHENKLIRDADGFDINAKKTGDPNVDEMMDKMLQAYLSTSKRCENLDVSQFEQRTKYLRQAAYANIPVAMINYASGLSFGKGITAMRDPGFDQWRKDAEHIANQALRRGVPEAADLYYSAYSDDLQPFHALITDDPVKAKAYGLLVAELHGYPHLKGNNSLSDADFRKAQLNSEAMYRNYFQSKAAPSRPSLFSLGINPFLSEPGIEPCTN